MAEDCITHTHTAVLPHGYRATFGWSQGGGLTIEWAPGVPKIESARHRRRFFEAYQQARRGFIADVATMIGGPVLVLDMTG